MQAFPLPERSLVAWKKSTGRRGQGPASPAVHPRLLRSRLRFKQLPAAQPQSFCAGRPPPQGEGRSLGVGFRVRSNPRGARGVTSTQVPHHRTWCFVRKMTWDKKNAPVIDLSLKTVRMHPGSRQLQGSEAQDWSGPALSSLCSPPSTSQVEAGTGPGCGAHRKSLHWRQAAQKTCCPQKWAYSKDMLCSFKFPLFDSSPLACFGLLQWKKEQELLFFSLQLISTMFPVRVQ